MARAVKKVKEKGLPLFVIQSLSWVALASMLIFDKGFGAMVNPPSDFFYSIALLTAISDSASVTYLKNFLGKK